MGYLCSSPCMHLIVTQGAITKASGRTRLCRIKDCIAPESNSARCSLPCTLTGMQYAPSEPWAKVGGVNHLDHLPHLHERALAAEVTQLSAPPTLRSGRLRHSLWVGADRHWAWDWGGKKRARWDARWNSPWPPGRGNESHTRGEAFFVAPAPVSPPACGRGIGRGDPRPGLRPASRVEGRWHCTQAAVAVGSPPQKPFQDHLPPLRPPPSESPTAATSSPGRSGRCA